MANIFQFYNFARDLKGGRGGRGGSAGRAGKSVSSGYAGGVGGSAGGGGESVSSGYGRGVRGSAGGGGESVSSGYGGGVGGSAGGGVESFSSGYDVGPVQVESRGASGVSGSYILSMVFSVLFIICALSVCFDFYRKKVSKAEEATESGLHVAPDVEKPTQAVEVADAVPVVLGAIVETSVDDLPKHGVYSEYNPYTSQATPVYSTKTKPPEPQIYINK